ncbi:MAG: sporulation integral membrane protein YtvI [Eubacteriales bacterium]
MDWKNRASQIGTAVAITVGLWLTVGYILPILMPFLVALLVAKIAQSPVFALVERVKMPKVMASFLVVSAIIFGLVLGVYGLGRLLWGELSRFTQAIPDLLQTLAPPMARLEVWLLTWAEDAPVALQTAIETAISGFFEGGSMVAKSAYEWLFSLVTSALSTLPQGVLFAVTALVASFMIAGDYDGILSGIRRFIPVSWRKKLEVMGICCRETLLSWLRAQGKLLAVTFALMAVGLLIVGADFWFLMALVIAVVDALPLFGAGAIMVPWAVVSLVQGDTFLAVGLAVLFAVGYFVRANLEPRFVGQQMGLHPLVSLAALYGGFRLFGIAGMFLCPFGAVLVKQLTVKR